jgi:2-keto-3-deoxy-L-rhamnonate aldolase RhmA
VRNLGAPAELSRERQSDQPRSIGESAGRCIGFISQDIGTGYVEKTANVFERMKRGETVLGTVVTINDPIVTEALCNVYDFLWIDTEHNPIPLDVVQGHLLAAKGTGVTVLVRVAWNDPVLIKSVLDIGAHGVIVPMISNVEDTKRAVAACRYPPDGIRGYGPRRPSNFGRLGGPEFCKAANDAMLTVVQIELADAITNIEGIVRVPGLSGILIGSNDLSGSLGVMGQPRHPKVLGAIETVIAAARKVNMPVGIAIGDDVALLREWIDKGINWVTGGGDTSLMLRAADHLTSQLRAHIRARATS